jgi:recombination protein RecT
MSELAVVKNNLPIPIQAIINAKDRFIAICKDKNICWDSEAEFAKQLVLNNDFLFKIALKNKQSLKDAMINIASIGLSLNPATAMAYLVPRDNKVCLDISYRGLVKLATDSGSVLWAKSEIVRKNDKFVYNGLNNPPLHEIDNPFDDELRGEMIGVYTLAKTKEGDYLCDLMSKNQIMDIRETSKSKDSKFSPWSTKFEAEMWKKSGLKRASKQWPKTDKNNLDTAISIIDENDGLDLHHEPVKIEQYQISKEMKTLFDQTFYSENHLNMYLFQESTNETGEQWAQLKKSFPSDKTINNRKLDDMVSKGRAIFTEIYEAWIEAIHNDDELGQKELEDFGIFQNEGMRMLEIRRKANKE